MRLKKVSYWAETTAGAGRRMKEEFRGAETSTEKQRKTRTSWRFREESGEGGWNEGGKRGAGGLSLRPAWDDELGEYPWWRRVWCVLKNRSSAGKCCLALLPLTESFVQEAISESWLLFEVS